ncbi:MAG TPA: MBL fold metallo-hydrolase [Gemmatimonadales bacterium]|nr:MBL fold metallo-hydrolase [Gemmatimonadales bacterium]
MRVTFWGTRGSIPTPGAHTVRYGGDTPCVSVEDGPGLLILDAGTGIRRLGAALVARRNRQPIDLLLSHTHWDHIQGLPYFAPVHDPRVKVRVHGPTPEALSLREVLVRQMSPPVSVAQYTSVANRIEVTEITAGELRTEYFVIRAIQLRHPGRTLGFSIAATTGGPTVNYLTDNELGDLTGTPEWQATLVGFLHSSEVLIHDATYDDHEIPTRVGWGHSSGTQAVDLAVAAGVQRLMLFHHAPDHGDRDVDRVLAEARRRASVAGAPLLVEAAAQGQSFDI